MLSVLSQFEVKMKSQTLMESAVCNSYQNVFDTCLTCTLSQYAFNVNSPDQIVHATSETVNICVDDLSSKMSTLFLSPRMLSDLLSITSIFLLSFQIFRICRNILPHF